MSLPRSSQGQNKAGDLGLPLWSCKQRCPQSQPQCGVSMPRAACWLLSTQLSEDAHTARCGQTKWPLCVTLPFIMSWALVLPISDTGVWPKEDSALTCVEAQESWFFQGSAARSAPEWQGLYFADHRDERLQLASWLLKARMTQQSGEHSPVHCPRIPSALYSTAGSTRLGLCP